MKEKKGILVAPLDWGIGHATRCIPIINALLENNFEVIIGADNRPLHLLKNEFPELEFIRFGGYNIKYPTYIPMSISMLLQFPKILLAIKQENQVLSQIIDDYNINGVISDNRFGLHTKKVPCVFITHQLQIQSEYLSNFLQDFNYKYINKYNVCWVMDNKEENLAGNLSNPCKLPNNTIYIGPQSRFKKILKEKKYDFLGLVSGPEPQRTIFEKGLIKALMARKEKSIVVLGKPEENKSKQIGNLTIKSHINAYELNTIILESELIICRPGYSTIMDLAKLQKKAFLIPTPGQTEQEYLANTLMIKNTAYMQNQSDFNFSLGVEKSKQKTGFKDTVIRKTHWEELFSLF